MDECYGKQIDYYNQLPNSSRAIEDILKRLEKAESQNEKLKNHLFDSMEDWRLGEEAETEFNVLYSDGSPSTRFDVPSEISFKIDKDNKRIILDIYQVSDGYGNDIPPVKILPTPAIIDINDNLNYIRQSDTHGGFYISFKNKADWENGRKIEIKQICFPVHVAMEGYGCGFNPIIDFLWFLNPDPE